MGSTLDPGRVVVTTGSSGGFILAFLAQFEPGDRVAVASPGYPPYRNILMALGCEPVTIEISAATRWAITVEALLETHRKTPLKGVIVASPANPTGTMIDAEHLAALIRACDDAGIRFISDEIYHGLDYTFRAETAAKFSERALVINSFSKYFCMTGWRIGWMVVPEALVRADRPAAAELGDLRADALAGRGRGRLRRPRRDGGGEARLRGEPEDSERRPAARGAGARFCPPTAPSISMPTSRASPTTASPSPSACSRKPTWRRRRASTSIS